MKNIFLLSSLAISISTFGQNIGNSPYAKFGLGDVKFDNTVDNSAMAGVTTAHVSDFNATFNFKNPAANSNLELTSIKFEGSNENNYFQSNFNNYKNRKSSSYLSNISLAFPLSKNVKMGLGYQPYSSKRYDVLVSNTLSNGSIRVNNYKGEGTINVLQAALGYQITPNIAIGMSTNYYYGNVYDIDELAYSNAELINGYETRTQIKNFNFTLGTTYQKKFKNNKLTIGATTTLGNTQDMEINYINSTYFYSNNGVKNNESIIESKTFEDKNLLPLEISLGAGFGHTNKWFNGVQMDYKKGESIIFQGQPFSYQDSYRFAAGGWVLPNVNNFRNYFQRVIYRYGAYYEKGSLQINNTNINEIGITFGATLPFKNTSLNRMTGFDIAIELGKRGTLKNNLINQNFINLKFGFNFADKWFNKAYYD